jgi:hypothetical protein
LVEAASFATREGGRMSNPNIIPHLDPSRSYIFCVRCEDMGHPNVEMRMDTHRFICPLQHELDIHTVQKLVAAGRKLHMVPLTIIESPPASSIQIKFWIHPATWAVIQEKFAGRMISTMDTFFNYLASGTIMFITGEDVTKLKALGISKPQDVIAAVEGMKELEELHKALIAKLQPIFDAAAGATEG